MKKIILVLSGLILSCQIFAKGEGENLKSLVERTSKLTGVQYIFPDNFKGKMNGTNNLKINKDNADEVLSLTLNKSGYTRIKVNPNLYSVISTRDIRYEATEIFRANKKSELNVPFNYDYYMLEYTFENEDLTTEITRSLRPFMSRFGRIIDIKRSNKIIIQDTGVNIHRLLNIVKSVDIPISKDEKERLKEQREFQRTLKLKKAESGSHCNCKEGEEEK